MKTTKRYVKPEINCYTIETTYLMSGSGGSSSGGSSSGGSGSGSGSEHIVEPLPGSGEDPWTGELD
mgnify:CR=1 FL=1